MTLNGSHTHYPNTWAPNLQPSYTPLSTRSRPNKHEDSSEPFSKGVTKFFEDPERSFISKDRTASFQCSLRDIINHLSLINYQFQINYYSIVGSSVPIILETDRIEQLNAGKKTSENPKISTPPGDTDFRIYINDGAFQGIPTHQKLINLKNWFIKSFTHILNIKGIHKPYSEFMKITTVNIPHEGKEWLAVEFDHPDSKHRLDIMLIFKMERKSLFPSHDLVLEKQLRTQSWELVAPQWGDINRALFHLKERSIDLSVPDFHPEKLDAKVWPLLATHVAIKGFTLNYDVQTLKTLHGKTISNPEQFLFSVLQKQAHRGIEALFSASLQATIHYRLAYSNDNKALDQWRRFWQTYYISQVDSLSQRARAIYDIIIDPNYTMESFFTFISLLSEIFPSTLIKKGERTISFPLQQTQELPQIVVPKNKISTNATFPKDIKQLLRLLPAKSASIEQGSQAVCVLLSEANTDHHATARQILESLAEQEIYLSLDHSVLQHLTESIVESGNYTIWKTAFPHLFGAIVSNRSPLALNNLQSKRLKPRDAILLDFAESTHGVLHTQVTQNLKTYPDCPCLEQIATAFLATSPWRALPLLKQLPGYGFKKISRLIKRSPRLSPQLKTALRLEVDSILTQPESSPLNLNHENIEAITECLVTLGLNKRSIWQTWLDLLLQRDADEIVSVLLKTFTPEVSVPKLQDNHKINLSKKLDEFKVVPKALLDHIIDQTPLGKQIPLTKNLFIQTTSRLFQRCKIPKSFQHLLTGRPETDIWKCLLINSQESLSIKWDIIEGIVDHLLSTSTGTTELMMITDTEASFLLTISEKLDDVKSVQFRKLLASLGLQTCQFKLLSESSLLRPEDSPSMTGKNARKDLLDRLINDPILWTGNRKGEILLETLIKQFPQVSLPDLSDNNYSYQSLFDLLILFHKHNILTKESLIEILASSLRIDTEKGSIQKIFDTCLTLPDKLIEGLLIEWLSEVKVPISVPSAHCINYFKGKGPLTGKLKVSNNNYNGFCHILPPIFRDIKNKKTGGKILELLRSQLLEAYYQIDLQRWHKFRESDFTFVTEAILFNMFKQVPIKIISELIRLDHKRIINLPFNWKLQITKKLIAENEFNKQNCDACAVFESIFKEIDSNHLNKGLQAIEVLIESASTPQIFVPTGALMLAVKLTDALILEKKHVDSTSMERFGAIIVNLLNDHPRSHSRNIIHDLWLSWSYNIGHKQQFSSEIKTKYYSLMIHLALSGKEELNVTLLLSIFNTVMKEIKLNPKLFKYKKTISHETLRLYARIRCTYTLLNLISSDTLHGKDVSHKIKESFTNFKSTMKDFTPWLDLQLPLQEKCNWELLRTSMEIHISKNNSSIIKTLIRDTLCDIYNTLDKLSDENFIIFRSYLNIYGHQFKLFNLCDSDPANPITWQSGFSELNKLQSLDLEDNDQILIFYSQIYYLQRLTQITPDHKKHEILPLFYNLIDQLYDHVTTSPKSIVPKTLLKRFEDLVILTKKNNCFKYSPESYPYLTAMFDPSTFDIKDYQNPLKAFGELCQFYSNKTNLIKIQSLHKLISDNADQVFHYCNTKKHNMLELIDIIGRSGNLEPADLNQDTILAVFQFQASLNFRLNHLKVVTLMAYSHVIDEYIQKIRHRNHKMLRDAHSKLSNGTFENFMSNLQVLQKSPSPCPSPTTSDCIQISITK